MGKLTEYFKYDFFRVMRPLAFHGAGKSGPFFEGWYFKLISADASKRISVIPGMYIGQDKKDNHAFIQVLDGVDGSSHYLSFPASDFSFTPGKMDITIVDSHFSKEGISLRIAKDGFSLRGDIKFKELHPWPIRLMSPGVMGWFAWVPGMECYHGIVSLHHHLKGTLSLNGQEMDFTSGHGYTEKDWGQAMPRAWVWMQSNHFEKSATSVSISIADIPWGKRSFTGFLGGLLLDGVLHRFATYTGAHIKGFSVTPEAIHFTLYDHDKRLNVTAHRANGINLQAPTSVQMDRRIMETLSASIDIQFEQKIDKVWLETFSGTGNYAGLEVVGDILTMR